MKLSKERVASLLDQVHALDAVLRARSRASVPVLSVLCYHSVGRPASDYVFDPEVVDASVDQFRAQLEVLCRHFTVLDIDTLCAGVKGQPLPPNSLIITFDDGYRSCCDVAMPILQEFGLTATFFIATHYVTNRRLYWWDRIHYLIKRSPKQRVSLSFPRSIDIDMSDRGQAARSLLSFVKSEVGLDLDRFLDELVQATDVAWSDEIESKVADELIMTWDDIRGMRDAGMDIQSHTRRHRVLQTLNREQLADELCGSRDDIERELGIPPRTVAYPVGYSIRDLPELRQAVEDAGYDVGFTNATGVNYLWRSIDPFDVRRIAMDSAMSLAHFRGQLALPFLGHVRRS
ncbi:MAG: polysaccharide deacetylase family protein [Haliangiales bacterium]